MIVRAKVVLKLILVNKIKMTEDRQKWAETENRTRTITNKVHCAKIPVQ